MSYASDNWVWAIEGLRPLQKLVLLALSHRINDGEGDTAFPSYARLVEETGVDRKTVWAALKSLKEAGLISDTGERVGTKKQIIVWRLHFLTSSKNGTRSCSENGTSSENGTRTSSKNGTRTSSKNGTHNRPEEQTIGTDQEEAGAAAFGDNRSEGGESAARMVAELKKAGMVQVPSSHPAIVGWVRDGVTMVLALECLEIAKSRRSGQAGLVHPNYLDPIIRDQLNAKPPAGYQPNTGGFTNNQRGNSNGYAAYQQEKRAAQSLVESLAFGFGDGVPVFHGDGSQMGGRLDETNGFPGEGDDYLDGVGHRIN